MQQQAKLQLQNYEADWNLFKAMIEDLARDRCIITNKNWHKIREIHLNQYLSKIENPFFFLFQVKFFCPNEYRSIRCIPKFYHLYKQERDRSFQWEI